MPRSHPPTLIKLVERCLEDECRLARGTGLLVAVSGGPDSMALLDVLGRIAKKRELRLYACGVDHGLRAAAASELALAEALAARWGVPFCVERVTVDASRNVQENARNARYAALRRVARESGSDFIVTAHHADDRAETVLGRLLRGAGPRGLAVLPARAGDLVRPLIRARRKDVLLHVERHRLVCADDPSNVDRRFLRTRIRHEVLPLLEALSPEVVRHLTALADQLGQGTSADAGAALEDESGELVLLNREQAAQLEKARTNPRRARHLSVPVAGSREIVLDPRTLAPVLRSVEAKRARGTASERASSGLRRAAGQKPAERG